MATNTFNVKEFNLIYSNIEDNSNQLSHKSSEIALCDRLSQIIKSTDSNLSSSYLQISQTIIMAKNKVVNLLNQLEGELKTYEANTLKNEEATDAELKIINSNIEEITEIFNSISGNNR